MHKYPKLLDGMVEMKHLLVIGNGFDIAHGMPTKYSDFENWLNEEYPDFIDEMGQYFLRVFDQGHEWWNDFENNLDTVELHDLIDEYVSENQPNYGSDDYRDADMSDAMEYIKQDLDQFFSEIKEKFDEWVHTIDIPDKQYMILKDFDFFLTFNYTNTLEKLYNIPSSRILHIHGKANNNEDLIIGHNGDPTHYKDGIEAEIPNTPTDFDPDEQQEWMEAHSDDIVQIMARQGAEEAVLSLKKNTEQIITDNRIFFGRINQLEEINFYGFSFAPVDIPYVEAIAKNTNDNAVWNIYIYDEDIKARKAAEAVKASLQGYNFQINIMSTSVFPVIPPHPTLF